MLKGKLLGVKCIECRNQNINFLDTYKVFNDEEEIVSLIFVRVFNSGNAQFSIIVEAHDNTLLYDTGLQNLSPVEYFQNVINHAGRKSFTASNFDTMKDAERESDILINDAILWLGIRLGQEIIFLKS